MDSMFQPMDDERDCLNSHESLTVHRACILRGSKSDFHQERRLLIRKVPDQLRIRAEDTEMGLTRKSAGSRESEHVERRVTVASGGFDGGHIRVSLYAALEHTKAEAYLAFLTRLAHSLFSRISLRDDR